MIGPVLHRETFEFSRAMEFFSERELVAQMGFDRPLWPAALLKELLDNALDAAESIGVPPVITVELCPDALSVQDNGPGLPLAVIERSLDYSVRVSDKAGYVSPTRGQQGNALKTLWAAPFVATGTGWIDIEAAGQRYEVRVTLDRIAQQPDVALTRLGGGDVKNGTKITLHWDGIASYQGDVDTEIFYRVLAGFTSLNPHLSLRVKDAVNAVVASDSATEPDWTHWRPDRPTSPHWYGVDHLRNLIALILHTDQRAGGRSRSINEFVRQFHGLSSTAKAAEVTQAAGLHRALLSDLIRDEEDIDQGKVAALLSAMQAESREVKPAALGILGEAHCQRKLEAAGAAADSIGYCCKKGFADGLPYVIEIGFGVRQHNDTRNLSIGINFSPAQRSPFATLDSVLSEARVESYDPVAMIVHLSCPRVEFVDRGKTRAQLPLGIREGMAQAVKSVTKHWTTAKRQGDRADRLHERHLDALRKYHKLRVPSAKAAAFQVMEQAYLTASDGGTLPANARQIMYAARPDVIRLTGKKTPWSTSAYFTQTLLPAFMEAHPDMCAEWDVVFDDRGHFEEPHTAFRIGVGTLAVRRYIRCWSGVIDTDVSMTELSATVDTSGPSLRYRHVLFIEKEGFQPLLEQAQIAERYDLGILSTKGMSVTAARHLVEALSNQGVTILVLHDFDESGFKIVHTLGHDTRRYHFKTPPTLVDIGLRLADVHALNLDSEEVESTRDDDPRPFLQSRGATAEEADFLAGHRVGNHWMGSRVELNAMDSKTFIHWLESKLDASGVKKVIPDDKHLRDAWARTWRIKQLNEALAEAQETLVDPPDMPPDMKVRLQQYLEKHPTARWDAALSALSRQEVRR